ncbi:MAG: hypothetical protein R3E39_28015 [Anaerolineae bacterium]
MPFCNENQQWLVVSVSLLISVAIFLWFAFRNLNPAVVWEHIRTVNAAWLGRRPGCIFSSRYASSAALAVFAACDQACAAVFARSDCRHRLRATMFIPSAAAKCCVILLQREHQVLVVRAATTV